MPDQSLFLKFPTGKISKGELCQCCARYNSRYTTTTVVVWQDEKVLLVHRKNPPKQDTWALPGGYLDWDETVTEAVQRELYEETGLSAEKLELIAVRSDLTAGDGRQNVDLFFLTRSVKGVEAPQEQEVHELGWFSITQLPQAIAFGHDVLLYELIPYLTKKKTEWPVLVL